MKVLLGIVAAAVAGTAAPPGSAIPGDARRGAQVFETQKCVVCHSVRGRGGSAAPDLAKRSSRSYTPSLMASLMWNHGPAMWPAMEMAGLPVPSLDDQQAADLFAFFYAFRYFEQPGDAGRGRRVFEQKLCAGCHGIERTVAAGVPAVATWKTLSDPIALAGSMWNHAAPMRDALAERKLTWPQITAQEMTDLVIYLRNLPQTREEPPEFAPASPDTGLTLFKAKGCAECHQGSLSLEARSRARTTADFAAAMWNHSPKMLQLPPDVDTAEMRRLVGYLWSIQFFESPGNASRGAKVFQSKNCAACHTGSTAPMLQGRGLNSISIASALWRHGPSMLSRMKEKNLKWPRFRDEEMSDLLAHLNATK